MLILPKSLLAYYSNFDSAILDDLNVIKALSWKETQSPRILKILKGLNTPDEINIDLGKIADPIFNSFSLSSPRMEIKWIKKQEDQINSGLDLAQSIRDKQFNDAFKLQDKLLKRGKYRHNIAYFQSKIEQKLLNDSLNLFGQPFKKERPQHGDLVVVDATIEVIQQKKGLSEFSLVDYPTPFKKESDDEIKLKLSDSTKEKLNNSSTLDIGWHPYCRVLGRYVTLEVNEPFLEPLLISFRKIKPVDIDICNKLKEEFEESINEDDCIQSRIFEYLADCSIIQERLENSNYIKYHLISEKPNQDLETLIKNNIQNLLIENNFLAKDLEKIKKFEDNIFSDSLGFFVGLYYFLKTYRGQNAKEIFMRLKNSFLLPNSQEWNNCLPYLRAFGVRFEEIQIKELFKNFSELNSST